MSKQLAGQYNTAATQEQYVPTPPGSKYQQQQAPEYGMNHTTAGLAIEMDWQN